METALQSSLYSAAVALCVFSAGLLRDRRTRFARAPDFFTLFLILEALAFALEVLMVHPAVPLKGLWLALRMGLSLLVAPCLWLAVKESADGSRPPWSIFRRGELFAIAAGLLLLLPLAANAHLGTTYVNPDRPVSALHSRIIHGTMLGCIAVFAAQVPFYLWRCRQLLLENLNRRPTSMANSRTNALAWLHLPLVAVLATWLLGLLRTVQCAAHAPAELLVFFAFADVSVTAGAIYLVVRRASAVAAESLPTPFVAAPVPVLSPVESTPPAVPYRKSQLAAPIRARIRRKIEASLADDALCCDSLLNLRKLSQATNENPRYVSQVISQDLQTTFYELVNRHRIERAQRLLRDCPDRPILEVALAVGFNSKSTFNAAFLRVTGLTPSAFRAGEAR